MTDIERHDGCCDEDGESCVAVAEKRELRRPSLWSVVLLNDDYTTMDFVIRVLVQIFDKTENEAQRLMMDVHRKGRGVAGAYSRDIAESLAEETVERARSEGFPLRCVVERQ